MSQKTVAIVVGSIRKDSFNRQFAEALVKQFPADLKPQFIRIDDLPLYDQDDDGNAAPPVARLRQEIKAADAVLFMTPEYNRSVPGVLKNAIDVGSRPWGQSVFNGKPAAVVSLSIGAIGGFGANNHLRQSLTFLNMPTLANPEMYVGGAGDMFAEDGSLKKDDTKKFFKSFADAFAAWIEKTRA